MTVLAAPLAGSPSANLAEGADLDDELLELGLGLHEEPDELLQLSSHELLVVHSHALRALEDRYAARARSLHYRLASRVAKAASHIDPAHPLGIQRFHQQADVAIQETAQRADDLLAQARSAGEVVGRRHLRLELRKAGLTPPPMPLSTAWSPYYTRVRNDLAAASGELVGALPAASSPDEVRAAVRELTRRAQIAASAVSNRAYTDMQLRLLNAVALANPEAAIGKVWSVVGDDRVCAACQHLDGTILPINAEFAHFSHAANATQVAVYQDLPGPPRHPNCRCRLVLAIGNQVLALGLPSNEGDPEFVLLHGHKGQPGYILLHHPDPKVAKAADQIYKSYGQDAVTQQTVDNVVAGKPPFAGTGINVTSMHAQPGLYATPTGAVFTKNADGSWTPAGAPGAEAAADTPKAKQAEIAVAQGHLTPMAPKPPALYVGANQWRYQQNPDGTFRVWDANGDLKKEDQVFSPTQVADQLAQGKLTQLSHLSQVLPGEYKSTETGALYEKHSDGSWTTATGAKTLPRDTQVIDKYLTPQNVPTPDGAYRYNDHTWIKAQGKWQSESGEWFAADSPVAIALRKDAKAGQFESYTPATEAVVGPVSPEQPAPGPGQPGAPQAPEVAQEGPATPGAPEGAAPGTYIDPSSPEYGPWTKNLDGSWTLGGDTFEAGSPTAGLYEDYVANGDLSAKLVNPPPAAPSAPQSPESGATGVGDQVFTHPDAPGATYTKHPDGTWTRHPAHGPDLHYSAQSMSVATYEAWLQSGKFTPAEQPTPPNAPKGPQPAEAPAPPNAPVGAASPGTYEGVTTGAKYTKHADGTWTGPNGVELGTQATQMVEAGVQEGKFTPVEGQAPEPAPTGAAPGVWASPNTAINPATKNADGSWTSQSGINYPAGSGVADNYEAAVAHDNWTLQVAHHASPEQTSGAQVPLEGATATIKGTNGPIIVTPEQLTAAITALEATKGTAVKQTMTKIGSPLAEMDYHAIAAQHPDVKAQTNVKGAVVHHLKAQLATAAPPPPIEADIGGVHAKASDIQAAIDKLESTGGTAVKQPLNAINNPLAAMDYHQVAQAYNASHHTELKVKPAVIAHMKESLHGIGPTAGAGVPEAYEYLSPDGHHYIPNPDGTFKKVGPSGIVVANNLHYSAGFYDGLVANAGWQKISKGQPGDAPDTVTTPTPGPTVTVPPAAQKEPTAGGAAKGPKTVSLDEVTLPTLPVGYSSSAASLSTHYKETAAALGGQSVGPGFLNKNEKQQWLVLVHSGKLGDAYELEAKSYAWKKGYGTPHPHAATHPGSPDNPANAGKDANEITHQWPAAVVGEVPAGVAIPGDWPLDSWGWSPEQVDSYLLAAGMTNSQGLASYQKKQWVNYHKHGSKVTVDQLSLKAQQNVNSGQHYSEEITPPKPVIPPGDLPPIYATLPAFDPKVSHAKNLNQAQLNDYLSYMMSPQAAQHAKAQPLATKQALVQLHYLSSPAAGPGAAYTPEVAQAHLSTALHELQTGHPSYDLLPGYGAVHHWAPNPDPKLKKMEGDGYGEKYSILDEDGQPWLFKVDQKGKYRAQVEATAHRAGQFFGFPLVHAEVDQGYTPAGSSKELVGLFQHVAPNDGPILDTPPGQLTQKQLNDMVAEHVLDWALDNDDGHFKNYLFTPDGHMLGIDKGRAWAHIDKDHAYSLNWQHGSEYSMSSQASLYYQRIYDGMADGTVDPDSMDAAYRHAIRRAKQMAARDDDQYREILRDGLKNRPGFDDNLVELIVARKNALPADFEQLWTRVYAKAGRTKPDLAATSVEGHHTALSAEFIEEVQRSQVHGRALLFGGTEVEDMHGLVWVDQLEGEPRLHEQMQLRKDADKVFDAWLKSHIGDQVLAPSTWSHGGHHAAPSATPPELVKSQGYFDTILGAAKTVSHHNKNGDEEYNAQKMADFEALKGTLGQLRSAVEADDWGTVNSIISEGHLDLKVKPEDRPQFKSMVMYYQGLATIVDTHKANKLTMHSGLLTKYDYTPVQPVLPQTDAPIAATQKVTWHQRGYTPGGNITPDGTLIANGKNIQKYGSGQEGWAQPGEFEWDLGNGVTVRYVPWSEPGVSQRGRLRVEVATWDQSHSQLEFVHQQLRNAGLELPEPTEADMELFYWRHLTGVLRDRAESSDNTGKYANVKLAAAGISESDPVETQLAAYRTAWGHLGGPQAVQDFVDRRGYLPQYKHSRAAEADLGTGHPFWQRFDQGANPDLSSYKMLKHSFAHGGKNTLKSLSGSGGLGSSEERSRIIGQWVGGASSSFDDQQGGTNDQAAGSSNFVFLRPGWSSGYSGQVYISPDVLLQTSTYGFQGDHYGQIKDRKSNSHFDLGKMRDYNGTEIMTKQQLTVLDDIEVIEFPDEESRAAQIKAYADQGIHEIRGMAVAERFVLVGQGGHAVGKAMHTYKARKAQLAAQPAALTAPVYPYWSTVTLTGSK